MSKSMKIFASSAWSVLAVMVLASNMLELAHSQRFDLNATKMSEAEFDNPESYPDSSELEKPILEVLKGLRGSKESADKSHVKNLLDEHESDESLAGLTTIDILTRCGFEHELHSSSSLDGYTTQLIRMVNPNVKREQLRKTPVVFYTGQGVSPAAFLMASLRSVQPSNWMAGGTDSDEHLLGDIDEQVGAENRSLAAMLSNNGFDVWLVPTRGVDAQNRERHAPEHNSSLSIGQSNNDNYGDDKEQQNEGKTTDMKSKLLAKKFGLVGKDSNSSFDLLAKLRKLSETFAAKSFWSFSSDEIIEQEFGLQLEKVRSVCKSQKVSVISYSNGGFIVFGFLSRQPVYAREHVDAVVSLAPAVFVNKLNLVLGFAGLISHLNPPIWPFPEDHIDALIHQGLAKVCKSKAMRYSACKMLLNQLYGPSDLFSAHLELDMLDQIGRPMSAYGLRQTLQASYAGKMREYDYGLLGNLIAYGQPEPNDYQLKAVDHEYLYVLSGDQDAIADTQSITQLIGSINCKPQVWTQIPGYNHLDLLMAHDNAEHVNLPVLKILIDRDIEIGYYHHSKDEDELGDQDIDGQNVRYEKERQEVANSYGDEEEGDGYENQGQTSNADKNDGNSQAEETNKYSQPTAQYNNQTEQPEDEQTTQSTVESTNQTEPPTKSPSLAWPQSKRPPLTKPQKENEPQNNRQTPSEQDAQHQDQHEQRHQEQQQQQQHHHHEQSQGQQQQQQGKDYPDLNDTNSGDQDVHKRDQEHKNGTDQRRERKQKHESKVGDEHAKEQEHEQVDQSGEHSIAVSGKTKQRVPSQHAFNSTNKHTDERNSTQHAYISINDIESAVLKARTNSTSLVPNRHQVPPSLSNLLRVNRTENGQ